MQYAVKPGQIVASDPAPYHLTGNTWSILDLSASQSGYAFAQILGTSLTDGAFVTTWRTTTADESITLPISGSDMTVDWGDGNTATGVSAPVDHTYNTAGDYTIQVTGGLTGFHLNDAADASKLVSLDQWGEHHMDHHGERLLWCRQHGLQRSRLSRPLHSHRHVRHVRWRHLLQRRPLLLGRLEGD